MTVVARSLLPSTLNVAGQPISCRMGPFSTSSTAQPPVLADEPCNRYSSSSMAVMALPPPESAWVDIPP